jgi:L-threonylcarbamoyladenylate synthase
MKTEVLPIELPDSINRAHAVLQAGGLVAFPTDTVYGVGGMVFNPDSIQRLYEAKVRQEEKAIPVLIGESADFIRVAKRLNEMTHALAARFWPGALTLVVFKRSQLPPNLSPDNTIGVRMPDHPVALSLLRTTGPLAVTSANLSGQANTTTAQDVLQQLDGRIDLILDGGRTPGGQPSTVVLCTGRRPIILREGPVGMLEIESVLA